MTIQEAIKRGYDIDRLRQSGKISPAEWAEYDAGRGEEIETLSAGGAAAEEGFEDKKLANEAAMDANTINYPNIKYLIWGVGALLLYNFFKK